jgi:hypothetical protein
VEKQWLRHPHNARAVGASRTILEAIDLNGWHGPARLVPYIDRLIPCKPIRPERTAGDLPCFSLINARWNLDFRYPFALYLDGVS